MATALLIIIFLTFIGLGLPDSLHGSGWVVIREYMNVDLSYLGFITMTGSACTIIAALMSDRLTKKFGASRVTTGGVILSAAALYGFSVSTSYPMLIAFAVPLGFGGGSIDAALNNYVALHYKSRAMNWMHCFWGVGAGISPLIMGHFLAQNSDWSMGYRSVSYIYIGLSCLLICSMFIWKDKKNAAAAPTDAPAPAASTDAAPTAAASAPATTTDNTAAPAPITLRSVFKIRGVVFVLIAFLCYCAMESTTMHWASSFLFEHKGVNEETAARFASFFFIGITGGRFLSGIISDKIGDRNMIRIGIGIVLAGIFSLWLPVRTEIMCLVGLVVIGLGCAPIFPSIIHATPSNFGKKNSQAIIGIQMASAYTGSTFMAPLFGIIAENLGIALLPVVIFIFAVLLLVLTEKLNKVVG
ncbi:MAG: MFS transporter [Oscillospiraceae bacterium]|nr:MFS transporter [Oscillospiraceae bacterium]